jgi:L-lactate dehydrogenase complex protein LldG
MTRGKTKAREALFDKLRTALNDGTPMPVREAAARQHLATRPRHLVPERALRPKDGLRRLFRQFLESQSATVIEVTQDEQVPAAVASYLRTNNLPQRVRLGDDLYLKSLPWHAEPALERRSGPAAAGDEVGLSHAVAGVAETGTLVLASGPDNPVTLNFVPETHIVVVEAKDLVGPYEDAWALLRKRFGDRVMPRTVHFISGPSRTGDIGGRLVMGAHGPQRMCAVVVGETE